MEPYRNCNRPNNCNRNSMSQNINQRTAYNFHSMHQSSENVMASNRRPGMAYVPSQEFGEMYDAHKGLCEGTMFPDLNLIFCGVRGN